MIVTALLWLLQLQTAYCVKMIEANSLVSCMDNNIITANRLSVKFWPDNSTVDFDADVNLGVEAYVYAQIDLYAYGFAIISKRVDPCATSASLKQLCPLYAGEIQIKASSNIGGDVINQIPGIAFSFPDIDVFAIVKIYSTDTDQKIGCVRLDLTNGKTVATTAVKWVTACISGAAIVGSFFFLYFGSIGTSQHIFAVSSLMFQYFQSQALLNLEHVERVPPMANAWSENLNWSLGLIYNVTIQKAFRWYIQATGGHPSTYKIYPTIAVLPQKVKRSLEFAQAGVKTIAPRVLAWAPWHTQTENFIDGVSATIKREFTKRENELASEVNAQSNSVLLVLRGIKRTGYNMGIEYTSIVITAFCTFWFILFAVAVIFGALWLGFWVLHRKSRDYFRHRHAAAFTPYIGSIFKGTMLYVCYMGFAPILVFSLWEFIEQDSAAVIVAAVVMLIAIVAIIAISIFRILRVAHKSTVESGTPAYLLYNDLHFRHRFSFIYGVYHAGYYKFLYVYFGGLTIKCFMLGLAQGSGRAQGLVIWLVEVIVLVLMCWKKPYLNKATNVINIAMQVIIMLNAFFYLFFSNLFTQPLAVNGVMGVIYFLLNAIFSLILLLYVIIYYTMAIFRENPDAHVTPAKDDRMSFIDEKIAIPGDNAELAALGAAAQADHDDLEANPESHNWFKTECGANRADRINPFDHSAPRRHMSNERLNTMYSEETSFRNSTQMDIPDLSDVDAHVRSPRITHHATSSQSTLDIMAGGFPGGNMPTGNGSPISPTFDVEDSLNPKAHHPGSKTKKWLGR